MNKKPSERKGILTDKGNHLVNAVDQSTIKLVQRLKTIVERPYVITIN